jgi:hypothetical protein
MSTGRNLGLLLRGWLAEGVVDPSRPQAIANRLIDALGEDDRLKGPLRDLTSRPQFGQVLLRGGPSRRTALESLAAELRQVYATPVWSELCELLAVASGQEDLVPEAVEAPPPPEPRAVTIAPPIPAGLLGLAWQLRRLGPGLALAAAAALVWRWAGSELDLWLFEPLGWNGGLVLVAVLGFLQLLALGPLRELRRQWPLELADAADPRGAWRWIAAPWIHHANAEAGLNLLILALVLGSSPLSTGAVVFRYALTALATMTFSVLVAQRRTPEGCWDGATGPVSALIALGAGASLLHWRQLEYSLAEVAVPAWVLLIVVGTLQVGRQLHPRSARDHSRSLERLLSCQWWWGLVFGLGWAVVSRLVQLLERPPAA